ncbi:MAG: hypothetical protein Q7U71_08835 [bacterium]|nr:hypothetical protein [bacterium]
MAHQKIAFIVLLFLTILVKNTIAGGIDSTYLITANSVGYGKIGMKVSEFIKCIKCDSVDSMYKEDTGWTLYKNKVKILKFGGPNTPKRYFVRGITIFDPLYRTRKGVHVGMTLEEFNHLYPTIPIHQDIVFRHDESFDFVDLDGKAKNYYCTLKVGWDNGEPVGIKYEPDKNGEYYSKEYRLDGYISSISIWKH